MTTDGANVLEQVADAQADFSLSVHPVLAGFYQAVGGPREFGRLMGQTFLSKDTSPASQIALGGAILKITIQSEGESNDDDGFITDEQVAAKLAALENQ